MIAGADDIDGMDLLRHGAIRRSAASAPHRRWVRLRAFNHGNVRQLAGAAGCAELAARTPLLPGGEELAFIDIDSMQKRCSPAKQGAAFAMPRSRPNR
jgi:hypothetical protein